MLTLLRFATTTANAAAETLGRLRVLQEGEEVFECCALELPYRGNRNRVSSLPTGTYVAEKVATSPAFEYRHLWVHDKDSIYAAGDRSGIKIHVANFARQLSGCIAVGQSFRDLDGDGLLDVTRSEETLKELLTVLPTQTTLTIRDLPDEAATPVEPAELEALGAPIGPISSIEDVH